DTMASIARFVTILGRRYPLVVRLIKKYCKGIRPAVCLRTYASWTSFNGGKLHDGKYLSENSAVAVTAPYKYWHEMQSKIMQQLSNNYARWRNCKAAESSNCNRLAKCSENDRTNNALTRLAFLSIYMYIYIYIYLTRIVLLNERTKVSTTRDILLLQIRNIFLLIFCTLNK
ncbi:hypothetical protein ALC56_13717, partial [Trachymyrmex septentrionalis]